MNAAEITLEPTMTPSATPVVVDDADIRIGSGRTRRFVGRDHGSGVSYFHVEYEPGEGPSLHWHPYTETWIVLEGTARFTVGSAEVTAGAGQTVVGPAGVWHRFVNAGQDRLHVLSIHASDVIIQTWAE